MKRRILLLDGEEPVRSVVASFLERAGYAVTATDDLGSVVDLCKRTPPDLILTSVYLPGMSGRDAIKFLKAFCPQVPFLMLSGLPDCRVVEEQTREDRFDIFPRPYAPQDLLTKINRTMGFGIQSLSA